MNVYWYAVLRRNKRTALLAGPFSTQQAAEAVLPRAYATAVERDPWCHFDTPATMSLQTSKPAPLGKLNRELGVVPCAELVVAGHE